MPNRKRLSIIDYGTRPASPWGHRVATTCMAIATAASYAADALHDIFHPDSATKLPRKLAIWIHRVMIALAILGALVLVGGLAFSAGFVTGGTVTRDHVEQIAALSRDLQCKLDEKQSPLTLDEIDNCVQAHSTPPMAGISDSSVSFYYGPFGAREMTIQIGPRHVQLVPTAEIQAARAGPVAK